MEKERRDRTRVTIKFEVDIEVNNERLPVKSWDLSMNGMKSTFDQRFKKDQNCKVFFTLNSESKIQIEGKIIRTGEDGVGIHFSSMDFDSFYHLKRIVQYNANDPDKIDKEIMSYKR